jgi:predicted Zn-dependent peptidase
VLQKELNQTNSTAGHKARFIGFYETVANGFENGVNLVERIGAITPKQISAVIKKYFKNTNKVSVIGVPQAAGKGK